MPLVPGLDQANILIVKLKFPGAVEILPGIPVKIRTGVFRFGRYIMKPSFILILFLGYANYTGHPQFGKEREPPAPALRGFGFLFARTSVDCASVPSIKG